MPMIFQIGNNIIRLPNPRVRPHTLSLTRLIVTKGKTQWEKLLTAEEAIMESTREVQN